jgi:hypothetical protein
VEALRKKERGDETQFTTKIDEKTRLGPSYIPFCKLRYAFDGPIMPKLFTRVKLIFSCHVQELRAHFHVIYCDVNFIQNLMHMLFYYFCLLEILLQQLQHDI